ncbi:MAG: tRNA lysidine(34) synthetase TilS, partial [Clostridia bacterium]|nr:tRNA lysidine(34) synthetase TilS [Clostridia bacterium]
MILNRIKKYIETNELLQRGDKVLVGLSGGADSVCLTHALQSLSEQLGIEVYTAHVNHGIRGEEAVRDEEFAKSFSEKLGISCFTARLNIPEEARQKSISEETAGRIARYEFFNKIAAENRLTKIATAHNRNDNAETLLMNFMRGSTVKGLGGIPVRRGNIVRPILCLTRAEIEEYCRENSLEYVTDSTNNETIYTRNKIRRELIPLIERTYNPNFVTTATENAVLTAEDNAYIAKQAENAFISLAADNKADIKELKKLDKSILRRVLMLMIRSAAGEEEDIRSVYIRDVSRLLNKNSGASVNLPFGIIA